MNVEVKVFQSNTPSCFKRSDVSSSHKDKLSTTKSIRSISIQFLIMKLKPCYLNLSHPTRTLESGCNSVENIYYHTLKPSFVITNQWRKTGRQQHIQIHVGIWWYNCHPPTHHHHNRRSFRSRGKSKSSLRTRRRLSLVHT